MNFAKPSTALMARLALKWSDAVCPIFSTVSRKRRKYMERAVLMWTR